MTTTANLALTLIETNQSQKETTANTALSGLDAAICDTATIEVADGTNEVDADTMREAVHLLLSETTSVSEAFDVELAAVKRLLAITNDTSYDATVVCADAATGAGEASLPAGSSIIVYCDGTQVFGIDIAGGSFLTLDDTPTSYASAAGYAVEVDSGATGLQFSPKPYDIAAYIPGAPAASQVMVRIVAARDFVLPKDLTGSVGQLIDSATSTTAFDIHKNGGSIGTMSFAGAASTATFTFASDVSFESGDILAVIAPASPDATAAGLSFTFAGVRN